MRYVPRTKAGRLEMQAAEIKRATDNGYTLEEHGGLKILSKDEEGKFYLKVYKDASAHIFANYFYRSAESRAQGLERIKNNYDSGQAYKAKRKAEGKHITEAAKCAQSIREELKKKFPGVKFSVTSENFSMGDSVNVRWEDGPTADMIDDVIGKYQYGHFNGMEDIYENSNTRDDLHQSKYVHANRKQSAETRAALDEAQKQFAETYQNNETYRIFTKYPIPTGGKVKGIVSTGKSGSIEDAYTLDIELPEVVEIEKPEVKAGTVQIIEHPHPSRKGKILVIGDTYPIKGKLRELGGRWNKWEKGWEFAGSELERISKALQTKSKEGETDRPSTTKEEAHSRLKNEVQKTIDFIADTDRKLLGEVSEGTRKAAEVQKCKINEPEGVKTYETLEEIEEAANSGQMISLCNLSELVNKPKVKEIGTSKDGFFRVSGPEVKGQLNLL